MSLSYKDISEILKIIDSSNCNELVLEVGDTKLVVQRNGGSGTPTTAVAAARQAATSPEPALAPAVSDEPVQGAMEISASAQGAEVRAPMVGTFYRKPSPADPAFVEPGQTVKKGDPLCLIEVMKLYTTIESPIDGTVAAIGAEDAALVAHDQVLFVIEPA